jgi:hypothetical protein
VCRAAQLFEQVCDAAQCSDTGCENSDSAATVLLLPDAYSVINASRIPDLVQLLNIGELRGDSVGALTFGAEIPEYKGNGIRRTAFPTAPTWQARRPGRPPPPPVPSLPGLELTTRAECARQTRKAALCRAAAPAGPRACRGALTCDCPNPTLPAGAAVRGRGGAVADERLLHGGRAGAHAPPPLLLLVRGRRARLPLLQLLGPLAHAGAGAAARRSTPLPPTRLTRLPPHK